MENIVNNDEEMFQKAANFVQTKAQSMTTEDLLYLYARYKQSLEGDCTSQAPSFWDLNGKKKYYAWKSVAGMEKSQSQQEYVERVSRLFTDWETEASNIGSQGLKLSNFVSRPVIDPSEKVSESSRTIYDWCQAGNTEKVSEMLQANEISSVDDLDEDTGMGLIHWASDRGNLGMIKMLIEDFKAQVDVKDEEGQTALHYAVSCEHFDAVKLLLSLGADRNVKDNEGFIAAELEIDNDEIKSLLK
ncbi:acyl-CoA-binding domain-containing protein 6-like [Convolutriloba macropyga]|uniref:acyl-CoA-binding domain-containing protein 6-like n=1 Tax=Convolutriloba macropyga TaxID=536237 RepID=UPI003F51DCDE